MSKIIPFEFFKLARTRDEVRRLVSDFALAMSELRAAFMPLAANSKVFVEWLDRAQRRHEQDCADRKSLQHAFERALASPTLAELVAARDHYVGLVERQRIERRRRAGAAIAPINRM